MAEGNLYKIIVETKGTSDPKEVESIDKSIGSTSDTIKNQDQLRKRINSLTGDAATVTKADYTAVTGLTNKLDSVLKNAVRNAEAKPPKTKTSKADDQTTKDLKEAAADNKETSKNLKEVSKNLRKETEKGKEEVKDKGVSVAPVVPKTTSTKKTALEEYEESPRGKRGKKQLDNYNKKAVKLNQPTQQRVDEPLWQGEELPPDSKYYHIDTPATQKSKSKSRPREWEYVTSPYFTEEAEAAASKKKKKQNNQVYQHVEQQEKGRAL